MESVVAVAPAGRINYGEQLLQHRLGRNLATVLRKALRLRVPLLRGLERLDKRTGENFRLLRL
jgi:hypothetical protein